MKKLNFSVELVKRIFIIVLIMTVVFVLIDFYVPLKRLFLGDIVSFSEIIGYIKLLHHFPYIIIAGSVIGFLWYKNDLQNEDK